MRRFLPASLVILGLLASAAAHAQLGDENESPAHKAQRQRDFAVTEAFVLNLDNVTRVFQASHALGIAGKTDPQIAASMKSSPAGQDSTLDEESTRMSLPADKAILATYGFTPREYAIAEQTFGRVLLLSFMGPNTDAEMLKYHVSVANGHWVKDHAADVEALTKKFGSDAP